jgi:hypothetical protein
MLSTAKNLISGAVDTATRTLTGKPDKRKAASRKAALTRAAAARKRSEAAKQAAVTRKAKAKTRSQSAKRGAKTRGQKRARVDAMLDAVRKD